MGIGLELARLATLVVREEREAALVDPRSKTIRTDGRPSGVAVASAIALTSGTSLSAASSNQDAELPDRVGIQVFFAQVEDR